MTIPKIAVVGHPNKGKSSIVATLVHNDNIAISKLSGTTTASHGYVFELDGQALYTIYDTPGFQRPRRCFEELDQMVGNAAERSDAINAFIRQYKNENDATFKDEIELLEPIMAGAGIIYVVDGAAPYSPEYEFEMTILQWTGKPRMALINPIGGEAYLEEWQQALGQFFSIVKIFNPLTADLDKQVGVLAAFAQLHEPWLRPLNQAVQKLEQHSEHQLMQTAQVITAYIDDAIAYQIKLPLVDEKLAKKVEDTLKSRYKKELTSLENKFRQDLLTIYAYKNLHLNVKDFELSHPDLFDQSYWYFFGLNKRKLIALGFVAGAATGAVVDASVGGTSFFTGTILGGLTAGTASYFASSDPSAIKIKGISIGGKQITAGPISNAQFRFVLLGRAVYYFQQLQQHTHANRSVLDLSQEPNMNWIEQLDKKSQVSLARLLQKATRGLSTSDRESLQKIVYTLLSIKNENSNA